MIVLNMIKEQTIKIALAQINPKLPDKDYNLHKHLEFMQQCSVMRG